MQKFNKFLNLLHKNHASILFFIYIFAMILLWHSGFFKSWESIVEASMLGLFPSFIFYFLFVHVPSKKRKIMITNNFLESYEVIKLEIISEIITSLNLHYAHSDLKKFIDPTLFKAFMEEKVNDHQNRYDLFLEKLDDKARARIVMYFAQIEKEISLVLLSIEINDEEFYSALNRIKSIPFHINKYDEKEFYERILSSIIYDLFLGYNVQTGIRTEKNDFIQQAFARN